MAKEMKTAIVICSTRPRRIGPSIAHWLHAHAQSTEGVIPEMIDLAEFRLPVFDESEHPRLHKYHHAHTMRFSEKMADNDAFVLVTPEYNHNPPSALTNALTYLNQEWAYKPVSFLSYGGISGGLRGVQVTKLILLSLKAVPIFDGIAVPLAANQIADTVFTPNDLQVSAAAGVWAELKRWNALLRQLR
jgi:NAD(P)H-dependent FMN reductase